MGLTRGDLLVRGAAAALGLTRTGAALAAAPAPRFRSRPDLDPPRVHVIAAPDMTAPGLVFVANTNGERQPGPMVIDDDGELIWFTPRPGMTVMNFNAHTLNGKPVLGWWEGVLSGSHGTGEFVLVGPDYRRVGSVAAGHGLNTDFHEFSLTTRGTALLIAYLDDGQLLDSAVQEIDVATGNVLLDWRASDHIALDESYVTPTTGAFDFAHLNAAAVDDDGQLLISSRHTWTVYKVDRSTGDVLWRLGGKRSDFAIPDGGAFAWQHHARRHSDGTLTVFDNGAGVAQTEPYSRGLQLSLDETAGTATVVREFAHPDRLSASAMGSMEPLDDDGSFVGWGSVPRFSEFRPDGSLRFDAGFPGGGFTYRAFRRAWAGAPVDLPAFVVSGGTGYASWNGATALTHWRLRVGEKAAVLTPSHVAPRRSFETKLALPHGARFAAVEALDARGTVLGRSAVRRI
jgi:outer membrane protein assembly factor BamB